MSPDGSKSDRQLMTAIARSPRSNAVQSYRSSSIGSGPARPMTAVVRQLTATAMAIATHSSPRQVPPPLHPAVGPIWRSPRPPRSRLPAALKSHSSSAPRRCAHAGPRFPPSRLIRRLPSEPAALSVTGRRPITLNDCGPSCIVRKSAAVGGLPSFAATAPTTRVATRITLGRP